SPPALTMAMPSFIQLPFKCTGTFFASVSPGCAIRLAFTQPRKGLWTRSQFCCFDTFQRANLRKRFVSTRAGPFIGDFLYRTRRKKQHNFAVLPQSPLKVPPILRIADHPRPHPSHFPNFLPPFPDPHTYIRSE
uniref:TAF8_C domain-containing protein n=1 Tax=Globodera pallida TaxID=36090 RepID=A0A183CTU9_GLOPA